MECADPLIGETAGMVSPSGFVLVTGGSRGIGAATARLAAEHGYDVCITYRDRAESAEAVVADVEATGVRAFLCAREAVRAMSTAGGGLGGAIVNVSSRAAVLGGAGEYVDYAASKAAVDTLTVGLSREVADVGIRVNAVRPGLIETEIHASGGEPGRVDRLGPTMPMGRGGTAEEVAEAILWLLSDKASYVTGSFLEVSGGR
jgi:NAD(P)-dependent dehydrogenase (short-subunit alcohol dehydrogenase family)